MQTIVSGTRHGCGNTLMRKSFSFTIFTPPHSLLRIRTTRYCLTHLNSAFALPLPLNGTQRPITLPSFRNSIDSHAQQAASDWNLAARLGTPDELSELEQWLGNFKKESIPANSFELKHARSSGKGGQNVNKVNTKVDMRFVIDQATWMPILARKCLKELEKGRINSAGEFVITSERTRTQADNFDDCVQKLFEMIKTACELPKATDPAKLERIKKLGEAEKHRRRENKEFRTNKKSSRRDWRD